MQQVYHVVIPNYVSRHNLTRARIYIAWTHSVGSFGNGIFHTAVTHIIWIERRIVLGIIANLHNILETSGFKRGVPI